MPEKRLSSLSATSTNSQSIGCTGGAKTPDLRSQAPGIRTRRIVLGLSRVELAQLAGVSLTSLANIEQGLVPRRSKVLARVLDELRGLEEATGPSQRRREPAAE